MKYLSALASLFLMTYTYAEGGGKSLALNCVTSGDQFEKVSEEAKWHPIKSHESLNFSSGKSITLKTLLPLEVALEGGNYMIVFSGRFVKDLDLVKDIFLPTLTLQRNGKELVSAIGKSMVGLEVGLDDLKGSVYCTIINATTKAEATPEEIARYSQQR